MFKYTVQQEIIQFSGGELTVRGLGIPDVVQIVQTHNDTARAIYDRFSGRNPESFNGEDAQQIAMEVITMAPGLIAHIIVVAADSPESFELACKLPVDVQLEAIMAIAKLSFQMGGGVKKFLQTVINVAVRVNGLVPQNVQQSSLPL